MKYIFIRFQKSLRFLALLRSQGLIYDTKFNKIFFTLLIGIQRSEPFVFLSPLMCFFLFNLIASNIPHEHFACASLIVIICISHSFRSTFLNIIYILNEYITWAENTVNAIYCAIQQHRKKLVKKVTSFWCSYATLWTAVILVSLMWVLFFCQKKSIYGSGRCNIAKSKCLFYDYEINWWRSTQKKTRQFRHTVELTNTTK